MVKFTDLEARRDQLAKQYREAKARGDTQSMQIIEIQGRAVRRAMDLESTKTAVTETLF